MDPAGPDRRWIETVLADHAKVPDSRGDYHLHTVFERERDRYLLMLVGWEGIRREHGCLVHVDIIGGKFWAQRDGTEPGVAQEPLDAGMPKDRIVLAFRSLKMRRLTDFAVT
jgi:hypothetical protein